MNFLNGTYFKHQCKVQLTDYKDERTPSFKLKVDEDIENNFVFCIPEFLQLFEKSRTIGSSEFTLVTHNSDINFTYEYVKAVVELFPKMQHWYTQNLLCEHPKVSPIPIGIANPRWSHGNKDRFKKIIEENNEKDNLYYANFNVSTNPKERNYCYKCLEIESPVIYPDAISIKDHDDFVNDTQEKYLRDISKSYFTVSPDGNGKDSHKTWEALYMKSIPIVKKWYGAERFKKLGIPMIILDDWSQFKDLKLNKNLYDSIWGDFKIESLNFDLFKTHKL